MTTGLATLQSRLKHLQEQLEPASKLWVLVLEQGQEIPPAIQAQIRPRDRVVIEETPKGYFGECHT